MSKALVIDRSGYKVGVNEIQGLRDAIHAALKPVQEYVKDKAYWHDTIDIDDTEYKSRDGFIPYTHNCGGAEISLIVPKGEEYDWSFLEFGEYTPCEDGQSDEDYDLDCQAEGDGHLDAKFRVWLKLEGYDSDTGEMSFYLYCGGGNGDAPYFRTKAEATLFESEFKAKTLAQFSTRAAKAVKALLKAIE